MHECVRAGKCVCQVTSVRGGVHVHREHRGSHSKYILYLGESVSNNRSSSESS